jgi:hypothetical protein
LSVVEELVALKRGRQSQRDRVEFNGVQHVGSVRRVSARAFTGADRCRIGKIQLTCRSRLRQLDAAQNQHGGPGQLRAWFGGLTLLFLTSAHAADFIFTRQAEGEERARGPNWTEEANIG